MRTRARLGAAATVGLGALLLATVLASPALAWHSNVTVNARCLDDGQVRVHYTVRAWETGHEAKVVEVSYKLNGETTTLDSGYFGPHHNQFSGHFDLAAGTTGTITFKVKAHWEGAPPSTDHGSDTLPPADKCAEPTPTTTPTPTTAPTPTTTPTPTTAVVAPSTSLTTPTTEGEEVLPATSTTSGSGQLPFTGASSGPMLLAGIGLVGGGFLFLLATRRHAAR